MNLEYITLENGKTYYIIQEKDNYVYLVNKDNQKDFCIRKNVIKEDGPYIESLDSKEEFDKAIKLFTEK